MTKDQLIVQEEYDEILKDIREMVNSYGKVVSIVIPQPKEGQNECAGMSHAFIEYSAVESAQIARRVDTYYSKEITKKMFSRKMVEACYHDHHKFTQKIYDVKLSYLK